ncbi:hypothetical protein ACFYQQ_17405 [Streptomyces sp. NPDC005496]|uniref:hypothetical protein n=1 Tax=unclassified Streptomyces TaxID=2593676 RepID=UPI0033B5E472
MYLVHAQLELSDAAQLPPGIRASVRRAIDPADRVEHVAVHPRPPRGLILGLYLLAGALEEAEERAVLVCERLLRAMPELAGARLTGAGVPVLPLAFVPQPVD